MTRFKILAWIAGLLPAAAMATPVLLVPGQWVEPMADGRMLGHLPYTQAVPAELVSAPPGFALDKPCLMQRDAAADLVRLLGAARASGVYGLRGVSCYRSVERQRSVFCGRLTAKGGCRDAVVRARSVGPPGYSEHATGYALDFGVRPSPGCADVDDCIAKTSAGQWLLRHANEYGFELSFPAGNAQGVTWEPWHWRWVGANPYVTGAGTARALFYRARMNYPAQPGVPEPIRPPAIPAPVLNVPTTATASVPVAVPKR